MGKEERGVDNKTRGNEMKKEIYIKNKKALLKQNYCIEEYTALRDQWIR